MTQAADQPANISQSRNDSALANAAILYYKEGLTQNEIAMRMGVSRPTVVNYLRQARENNVVDIRINGFSFSQSNLSRELRDKFSLVDVYVADYEPLKTSVSDQQYGKLINQHIARVGAEALFNIVQPGDVLGVAWGETIQFLADEVPRRKVDNLTVCQMIGSMKSPLISTAEGCAIRISSRLGADCYTLHAPAILSTAELATALCAEPVIAEQLSKFSALDCAVFSVGSCETEATVIQSSITPKADFDWYRSQGAVGVLCGRFIDENGNHIVGTTDSRMVGVSLDQLKSSKTGVLVAGGPTKVRAILATLVGGYVSHLVTDGETARELIQLEMVST